MSQCNVNFRPRQFFITPFYLFQEQWVHGKTGACGFNKPNSKLGESKFKSAKDFFCI